MSERQGPKGPPTGQGQGQGPKPGLFSRSPILIILLIVGLVLVVQFLSNSGQQEEISYSRFKEYVAAMPVLEDGKGGLAQLSEEVENAEKEAEAEGEGEGEGEEAKRPRTLEPKPVTATVGKDEQVVGLSQLRITSARITGRLKPLPGDPEISKKVESDDDGYIPFFVEYHEGLDTEIGPLLSARGIPYEFYREMDWSFLLWLLPLGLIFFLVIMMFRSTRMQGENVLSFGRSKAKIAGEEKTGVTFADVAGAEEAKEELSEIVEFLKEPGRFTALGGKIPKGCLLMGPPGCGKTLLARAVAGEADVPFFSISGSDFVEMFVGVGAARVRDLFSTAGAKAPCIVFVDEIDAVGRHRGTGMGGGHDEREQTLNQLLVEMDGFDGRKGVIVIAATNRPDILDPALLRPGRFDRQVTLDAPDLSGRKAILKIHSRDKPLEDDVDVELTARRTPGFSGADLANVMNEAALLAARRRKRKIGMSEVAEAIERVVAGPERRSRIIGPRERRILAYHELGHALVARFSEHADKVHKVSIIPRGRGALGYTLTLPDEDRYIITREELEARIRVFLGGRTAEEVIFGHKSTGAEDDLQKATQLARSMVCRWGMTSELGPIAYERAPGSPFIGRDQGQVEGVADATSQEIDRTVRALVEAGHSESTQILTDNRKLLDRLAEHLIQHEVLDLEEFERAVQNYADTPPPPLPEGSFTERKSRGEGPAEPAKENGKEATGQDSEEGVTAPSPSTEASREGMPPLPGTDGSDSDSSDTGDAPKS